jgi:hypothetical protein
MTAYIQIGRVANGFSGVAGVGSQLSEGSNLQQAISKPGWLTYLVPDSATPELLGKVASF